MGGRGSWAAPGGIPGAGDLVTYEFCHWWLRDLAAPADHVGPVFDLVVQGDVHFSWQLSLPIVHPIALLLCNGLNRPNGV